MRCQLEDKVHFWAMHQIENEVGQSTDVLRLVFYPLSFFSSTTLKAKGQKDGCLQQIFFFNRKMKCIFFLLIFCYLFLAKRNGLPRSSGVSDGVLSVDEGRWPFRGGIALVSMPR